MQLIKSDLLDKFFIKKIYVIDNYYYEIHNIIDILDINHCLYHFLRNPFLNYKKKWIFIYTIFHLEYFSLPIIKLVLYTKTTYTFEFMKLWNIKKKWVHINIITSVPLSYSLEEYLINGLKKSNPTKKFYLKKKVNNSLIGGLRLRIEDKEWDSSLEEKIRKLRRHFKNHI